MKTTRIISAILLMSIMISCASINCGSNNYCVNVDMIDSSVYRVVTNYIKADKSHNAFTIFSSTFFDYDRSTLNKKTFDFLLIGPNYIGLIDSTGYKHKYKYASLYGDAYDSIAENKVAPRRYPVLHCHINGKIVFIQSSLDEFISNKRSTSTFRRFELETTNGRSKFMLESMGIIKHPNGTIKTFIVGDTILTEEKLREHF